MGAWQRFKAIFQAKTNKALDKMEDPRETLDLSYEKQLENLTKVRRAVADVATARKRIELQATELQKQADKLQDQAKAALTQGNEDLAREALARRAVLAEPARRPQDPARPGRRPGAEAHRDRPAAPGRGRLLPHQEGDHQGHLHRRRGPDQDRRGRLGHLGVDERRRRVDAACPGQDRPDAGPGRRDGRAAGLGALTDLTHPVDDIQAQLDKVHHRPVDNELAALKAEVGAARHPGARRRRGEPR